MAHSDFVNRSRGRRRPLRAPSGFVPRLAEAGGSRRPARDQDLAAEGAAHAAAWRKGRAELEGEACPLVQLGSDGRSDPRTLAGASAALLHPTPGRRREARVEEDGVRPRTCDWTLNSGQCSPIYRGTKETRLRWGRAGPHPPPWRSRALLPMAALRTLGSHGASVAGSGHLQTYLGASESHQRLVARWQVTRWTVGWTHVSNGRTWGSCC